MRGFRGGGGASEEEVGLQKRRWGFRGRGGASEEEVGLQRRRSLSGGGARRPSLAAKRGLSS